MLECTTPRLAGEMVWRLQGWADLWSFEVSTSAAGEALGVLDPDERRRAAAFRDRTLRERYVVGRATVRQILANYRSEPAQELRFSHNVRGKPKLSGEPRMTCNWSHSGACWLLAVASDGSVGVDIERIDTEFDWRSVARVALHPHEVDFVTAAASNEWPTRFFRIWTLKEALLKAQGSGLDDAVAEVCVVDSSNHLKSTWTGQCGGIWYLAPVDAGAGYVAALATAFPLNGLGRYRTSSFPFEHRGLL